RRLAVEAEGGDGPRLRHADPAPVAARRRRGRDRGVRVEVQAPRRLGQAGHREAPGLSTAIALAAGVAALAAAYGWWEAGWVRLRVLDLPLDGLPPELDGFRVAHLSDFHLGVP